MAADQAAGLRRRRARQPGRRIHCFFETATSSIQLMQALHQLGQAALLVDTHGRLFADQPARSLFDWKQQLARGQLQILPKAYGDGWYAPGVRADASNLQPVIQRYDCVVFDAGPVGNEITLIPGALNPVGIEIHASADSIARAYRLLKTLSHVDNNMKIGLVGDAPTCEHVYTACRHFLEQTFTQGIYIAAHEDDAFAALAGRMAAEETHRMTRCR